MKSTVLPLLVFLALPAFAQNMDHASMGHRAPDPHERLGTVSFPVSCAPASQPAFNRGVALLHDFWYEEARANFNQLAASEPGCAMAHWGIAMSFFHQIWDRPDDQSMKNGWAEMQKAQGLFPCPRTTDPSACALPAKTAREGAYIAALAGFYRPGSKQYPERISEYSAAMGKLYAQYPNDVDAGTFYALSLLAAEPPNDTSLSLEHKAMAVLKPLRVKYPDHPGVLHYIVHACDNPEMAADGLTAADHYGEVSQSGPHAFHMPGHIYARLGLWSKDITDQLGSIEASEAAEARGESGIMDELHSYDFMLYACLQSGRDACAKSVLQRVSAPLQKIASMPGMGVAYMDGMVPYYRMKLPVFYALEMRDWKSAAAMERAAGAPPEVSDVVYWARAVGHGRLHQADEARKDLKQYDELMAEVAKGRHAYSATGTFAKIERGEMSAWTAFAAGNESEALKTMRTAADLQDKVGQAEVDIPAREMLADMLQEFGHPQEALAEYKVALKLSPNRLNGLYNAGRAAERAGQKAEAKMYYSTLLKISANGANSARPEFGHAKIFLQAQ